jgi:Domain of unknown function (DUF4386)
MEEGKVKGKNRGRHEAYDTNFRWAGRPIPNTLFVYGDATAMANNIAAHESLFRWGIVSQLLGYALWLFVPLALYRLLKLQPRIRQITFGAPRHLWDD